MLGQRSGGGLWLQESTSLQVYGSAGNYLQVYGWGGGEVRGADV